MSQPEASPSPVVQAPAEPIVIQPITKAQSTTLKLNVRFPIWTAVATVAATIVDLLMQAFADPALAPLLGKWFPLESRVALVALVTILSRMNWKKRMETAQPIVGSPGEAKVKEQESSL